MSLYHAQLRAMNREIYHINERRDTDIGRRGAQDAARNQFRSSILAECRRLRTVYHYPHLRKHAAKMHVKKALLAFIVGNGGRVIQSVRDVPNYFYVLNEQEALIVMGTKLREVMDDDLNVRDMYLYFRNH